MLCQIETQVYVPSMSTLSWEAKQRVKSIMLV